MKATNATSLLAEQRTIRRIRRELFDNRFRSDKANALLVSQLEKHELRLVRLLSKKQDERG